MSDHIAPSFLIPILVFHFVKLKSEVTISTGGMLESQGERMASCLPFILQMFFHTSKNIKILLLMSSGVPVFIWFVCLFVLP